ncbi:unnamed protein product [Coffea canephora]|uniref:SAM-dependent MTase DRM-type domain-containing protein n=1 Tax=Coffea canephora TaxID=49390 RepID=A0A068TS16_COFCA|nr:unnamed protein product [Coffea canephora]
MTDLTDGENSSKQQTDVQTMPKVEPLSYDLPLPSENVHSRVMVNNVASSSSSNTRSFIMEMGFEPYLVDRAIREHGEDNVDLILQTLFACSAPQKPKSEHCNSVDALFHNNNKLPADCGASETVDISDSSDSLDSLFGDDQETCSHFDRNRDVFLKEEPDVDSVTSEKKASLVAMSFSKDEVEFAMNELGVDASISDLVDFIFAAQIADNYAKGVNKPTPSDVGKDQQFSTEALFGTMEKTLVLFEMGFSEQQISTAIEKHGSEVPVSELAASIVAEEDTGTKTDKHLLAGSSLSNSTAGKYHSFHPSFVKAEEYSLDDVSCRNFDVLEKLKGKRPKEKCDDELCGLKIPKQEYNEDFSYFVAPVRSEATQRDSISYGGCHMQIRKKKIHRGAEQMGIYGPEKLPMPKSCRAYDDMLAKPPYFFFGNVISLTHESWVKISQFLYAVRPEFVSTDTFSALSREEGYVHNLPTQNRFHILPKPPMTIQEAIPRTAKWWPSWDTRKQLSALTAEATEMFQACERLGRMVGNSRGLLSVEQQSNLLHQCKMFNLLWVGPHKLAPIEPEDAERIFGYPVHHTRSAGFILADRLSSLKNCFQIDTLAYHLSVLKSLFPGGLTVLSIYSGIGGAELALYKLGIQLKVVVSIEPCEIRRRILKHWWEKRGITGELVQMESLGSRLAFNKLDGLIHKYGGFDIVIGQNPSTSSSRSSCSKKDKNSPGLDFQLFYEFVRALQLVRSTMEKNSCHCVGIKLGKI